MLILSVLKLRHSFQVANQISEKEN